jgi:tripartite-type tricarboxylate transporter receptor subunit TctC
MGASSPKWPGRRLPDFAALNPGYLYLLPQVFSASAWNGQPWYGPLSVAEDLRLKLHRRGFLQFAAGTAALPLTSRLVFAQAYPSRPVRVIVGLAAGGGADIAARLMAQGLSERLGQSFVVENRVGGASNLALEAVVRAPPDGYTLLSVIAANAINATLYDKLGFNVVRDIAPIAGVSRQPQVIVVNPSFPARTVPELIAYAKAHPAAINYGSGGNGTTVHVAGELFKMLAGVDLVHVPYRGEAPALADLIGGQLQVMFATLAGSIEFIRSGNLRLLAVTSGTRLEALPEVPAVNEFVPGYEAISWSGIGAPRNTPSEIVERISNEVAAGLADSAIRDRIVKLGNIPMPMSPTEFGKFIANETDKWGRVVKFARLKVD